MSESSEILRRAAKVLREHAEAAIGAGRWESHGFAVHETRSAHALAEAGLSGQCARYIALMDPMVGMALADWLGSTADIAVASTLGPSSKALAVARAVLREDEHHD